MTDVWMPGAQRLDIGDHAPTDGGPAKAIAHITWDRNATAARPQDLVSFEALRSYFSGGGKSAAPHILWDPFTGRIVQFVPANSRSKSLVDKSGGTRTNRAGSVVVQVEALFFPYCRVDGKVYAKLSDTPCKGWKELNAWIRSLGVPDVWPMGKPQDFTPHRSESTWETHAGWYAHAHVPENDHQDPGSWPAFVTDTPAAPKPSPAPSKPAKPKVSVAHLNAARAKDIPASTGHTTYPAEVKVVEAALKAEGFLNPLYASDGSWGTSTDKAFNKFRREVLHLTGDDATGSVGLYSLKALASRHNFEATA
jgi:hypothetical protein